MTSYEEDQPNDGKKYVCSIKHFKDINSCEKIKQNFEVAMKGFNNIIDPNKIDCKEEFSFVAPGIKIARQS